MSILRLLAVLLIASGALAQGAPAGQLIVTQHDFAADLQNHDGPNKPQIRIAPMPWTQPNAFNPDSNTCYFIRSYVMKREGEAGATHLDHVTTCTPKSRIRMKTKVKFTPAVEQ